MSGTTAVTDNAGNGNIMMNNISIYEVNKVSLIRRQGRFQAEA